MKWTIDEEQMLKISASEKTPEELHKLIPNHNEKAIDLKCLRLGIKRKYRPNYGAKGNKSPLYKGYEQLDGRRIVSYKANAKKRKLKFSVSPKYLWKILERQNFRCALSNLPIVMVRESPTASLDRIDSSKGYIRGNIQWLHKDINFLKQNCTQERFIELCIAVAKTKGDL
jgi:hypothetical protein